MRLLVSSRTFHQSQTWRRCCVQLPMSMSWWVSSTLHTGRLWSADQSSLLLLLPLPPPNSLSGRSLADWGHRLIQKSQHLQLSTSTWMSWKVGLNIVSYCLFCMEACQVFSVHLRLKKRTPLTSIVFDSAATLFTSESVLWPQTPHPPLYRHRCE